MRQGVRRSHLHLVLGVGIDVPLQAGTSSHPFREGVARRELANRLLLDTDLPLVQLCRQLGYAEQSVLTRVCKRWFGMTPTDYRNSRNK